MSLIICSRCDKFVDSDRVDCVNDPKAPDEMMCLIHEEDDEVEVTTAAGGAE
jgi:hypothetical protein